MSGESGELTAEIGAPAASASPEAAGAEAPRGARSRLGERLASRLGLVTLFAVVVAYFAVTEPAFRTWDNIQSTLLSVAVVGLLALGVTLSMVVGGFDLSVGANAGFTVMICSLAMVVWELPTWQVVLIGLGTGLGIGLLNGVLIVGFGIPDLLATLGVLFAIQGAQLLPSEGASVSTGMTLGDHVEDGVFTERFLWLGRGEVHGVPVPVIVFFAAALLTWLLLERTRWGRMLYAIGGNSEAARLAGIRVQRLRLLAYLLAGVLSAAGGIILAARIGQGDVGAGNSFLLDAVAATLVGFAVLGVNRPNALGTTVGAVFLGVMLNGLTMKSLPYYTQDFVKGLVLMLALFLSFGIRRRAR